MGFNDTFSLHVQLLLLFELDTENGLKKSTKKKTSKNNNKEF